MAKPSVGDHLVCRPWCWDRMGRVVHISESTSWVRADFADDDGLIRSIGLPASCLVIMSPPAVLGQEYLARPWWNNLDCTVTQVGRGGQWAKLHFPTHGASQMWSPIDDLYLPDGSRAFVPHQYTLGEPIRCIQGHMIDLEGAVATIGRRGKQIEVRWKNQHQTKSWVDVDSIRPEPNPSW